MRASLVLRLAGWIVILVGAGLLVATGDAAVALGTSGPMPANGASDPAAMVFWRQLTFIRLFATAAIALGAVCLWSRRHLTAEQQSSFLRVLAGSLMGIVWMALSQQTAIWNTSAGWAFVGVLTAALLVALSGLVRLPRTRTEAA